jgi:MYXO-CTERM domain-containing protein
LPAPIALAADAPQAKALPPTALPQVNITATSVTQVKSGDAVYNLLTPHGGVTYQFLIVEAQGAGGGGGTNPSRSYLYYLLLLLLILLVLFWRRFARRRPVS